MGKHFKSLVTQKSDIACFVETAGRLCYQVHFAWMLHSPSFHWIFFEWNMVSTQRILGERTTAHSVEQQLKQYQ